MYAAVLYAMFLYSSLNLSLFFLSSCVLSTVITVIVVHVPSAISAVTLVVDHDVINVLNVPKIGN